MQDSVNLFVWVWALVSIYAALVGFDLGAGIIGLCDPRENLRASSLRAAGRQRDANELWLLAAGAVLLLAFPRAGFSFISGFRGMFQLLLGLYLLRIVSLALGGRTSALLPPRVLLMVFRLASLGLSLIMGMILGNILIGLPLNDEGQVVADFTDFFGPLPLFVGLTTAAGFAMQGMVLIAALSQGETRRQAVQRALLLWRVFIFFFALASFWIMQKSPVIMSGARGSIWFIVQMSVFFGAALILSLLLRAQWLRLASFASAVVIASVPLIVGERMAHGFFCPVLIPDAVDPLHGLTIAEALPPTGTARMLLMTLAVALPGLAAYSIWRQLRALFALRLDGDRLHVQDNSKREEA